MTKFSDDLHAKKYRGQGENFKEAMNRQACILAPGDYFKTFREIILDMRFMAAGRIQSAIGSMRKVTPYNCFVSGEIEDSMTSGQGSIMRRAMEAAETMRMGGGIGYDFSTLRPRGDKIKKLGSSSSGPVSFMTIFDAICNTIASSGHRRGAQMGVLRVDHPDIEEFIRVKQNDTALKGFNLSIAITDEFMKAVEKGGLFSLKFEGQRYKDVDAHVLWEMIMRSTWDWAEPGVLFIDTINRMNNLSYCETIAATNPCGEQPLPPYGACLLGSFNLVKYVTENNAFHYDQLIKDIPHVVRAMDNVIDVATYPLYEHEKEAKAKRRMGIGVTGLGSAAAMMDLDYGSEEFLKFEDAVLGTLRNEVYRASIELAKEKGQFPMLKDQSYLVSGYCKTLPDDIIRGIQKYGIRNSHLISIAPTGTISMCADNVSSGIEPIFDYETDRIIETEDGPETYQTKEYAFNIHEIKGKTSKDVTVAEHLAVLTKASQFVDSAVSKTCNVPPDTPWEDFKQLYFDAWKNGCKGCTTFQINGKRAALIKTKEDGACYYDPKEGKKSCE
jgi:ribonucleoside-diphosphate reductase alpha chain